MRSPRDLADRMARRKREAADDGFVRVKHTLPRIEAREKATEFFRKYPSVAYMTAIDHWRVLPDDVIEFTMKRLKTAD